MHLGVLVFGSLPIVMLCLPLGGMSLYEVLATYLAMAASVIAFGMISLAGSSYFTRTIAALVVSYLIILPLALIGVLFYRVFEAAAEFRLVVLAAVFPAACLAVAWSCAGCQPAAAAPARRGGEAQEVVDPDDEQRRGGGHGDPQRPVSRHALRPAQAAPTSWPTALNPVYDKEMRSEIFGHGTLMLRLVIQMSMCLALLVMAVCLYIWPPWAAWYTSYVLLFNMLVGPVFSAGSVTSERERQTLELLLTTALSPWQILCGKLFSSLRISMRAHQLPALAAAAGLAACRPGPYWHDTPTMIGYLAIILLTCLTTTTLAMFCSVLFRKTSVSMMTSYLVLIVLFAMPVVAKLFAS